MSYVMSLSQNISLKSRILAQSLYNREICPTIACAILYAPEKTRETWQEIPVTVDVVAQDVSTATDMQFEDVVGWFAQVALCPGRRGGP